MSRETVEFALKCMSLHYALDKVLNQEPSVRVWIGVLMQKIIEICNAQEDTKSCFDDVIEALRIERNECDD